MNWISFEEEKPKDREVVLLVSGGEVRTGRYIGDDKFFLRENGPVRNVRWWQRLPEIPEEGPFSAIGLMVYYNGNPAFEVSERYMSAHKVSIWLNRTFANVGE